MLARDAKRRGVLHAPHQPRPARVGFQTAGKRFENVLRRLDSERNELGREKSFLERCARLRDGNAARQLLQRGRHGSGALRRRCPARAWLSRGERSPTRT